MKKVVIYFFIVCGVSLTSCSDFMNITPQDSITPNAVFSSLSSTRLFIKGGKDYDTEHLADHHAQDNHSSSGTRIFGAKEK